MARYDWVFFLEAAPGKPEMVRRRSDATLLVKELSHSEAKAMTKGSNRPQGTGGLNQRKQWRKQGACFRYNRRNGARLFRQKCTRLVHACSNCGGKYSASRCLNKVAGKVLRQDDGGLQ